jgi:hypothetical protein
MLRRHTAQETLVTVDKGVQLLVLDWGSADKSRTMVLITGLGDNAHVYDQFAPATSLKRSVSTDNTRHDSQSRIQVRALDRGH